MEAAADTEDAAEADNSEEAAGEDEILKKNKKIEELTEQLSAEKDKYLRVAAEYDNFRRRSLKDKEDAADKAKSAVIIEFLGVIDTLILLIKHLPFQFSYISDIVCYQGFATATIACLMTLPFMM